MADILGLVNYKQNEVTSSDKISKNPGLAILLVDGFSELLLLHSLEFLPANLLRPENRLVALSGAGPRADCYRIDPTTAFKDIEFAAPLWRDLKGAATADVVASLKPQDQNAAMYKGKQVLIVPPLVSVSILEANTLQPASLVPILSAKF